MSDLFAIITIMVWPLVPLFWIPVHGLSRVFKRLGIFTYIMLLMTWVPIAYLIYINRSFFLQYKIEIPLILSIFGFFLFTIGTILHIWTGLLLGLWGLIGLPEVSKKIKGKLITKGPFSVVRHPTYLAHTLMFSGIFFITEVIAVSIITLMDLIFINLIIIPLEEKELLSRFGQEYKNYKEKVRSRFFPL